MNKYSPFTDKYPAGEVHKRLILKMEKESKSTLGNLLNIQKSLILLVFIASKEDTLTIENI